ncbi:MAG: site-2 protease family protein [Nitrososphaerales archaeon]|nr:site-2 protease family protein [Nitrososphaerales archaeon]
MSLPVGKIMGVEIRLHYTWFIIFVLITSILATLYMPDQYPGLTNDVYWITGFVSSIILFSSVLFHELFHTYFALRKGIPVPNITLFLFGGVTQITEEPQDPDFELKMAFAGPASSFLLSLIFGLIWLVAVQVNLPAIIVAPLNYGWLINALLGGFNLIPAFPMDGGRILRAGIWKAKKDMVVATRMASRAGEAISYLFIFFGLFLILFDGFISGLWFILIGWFIKSGAEASLKQTIISQALSGVNVGDIMTKEVHTIAQNMSISDVVENYFYKYKHGGFPVVEDGNLLGMLTTQDVRAVAKERWNELKAKDIMTSSEKLVKTQPEEPVVDAFLKLSKRDIGRLPVVKDRKLVGIISRSDVMHIIRVKTELVGKR